MEESGTQRRWGTEQRLEFIEFRLFWDGSVNRSDITDRFGVSIPQASADLAQYRELCPENMEYDSSEKRYVPTATFNPYFLRPNAERYLSQLRALAEKIIFKEDTWIEPTTDFDASPVPARRVQPHILRYFLKAIREHRSTHIEYQSMNDVRPEPAWRIITPHAFASDGLRWHLRAYCHLEQSFKDFIISRCLSVGQFGEPGAAAEKDTAWTTFFNVVLMPNPKLSAAQRKAIELDYGMKDAKCELAVRYALLYYFDKRLRLDIHERQDRPKETPIIVANRTEYNKALKGVL